jgi:hypothetical protein
MMFFVGCDQASLIKKMTPPEDETIAKNYVGLLRQGKLDQIEDDLNPTLENAQTRDTLANMAAMFPAEEPVSIKVVGVRILPDPDVPITTITLEYEFPQKWLLVNVVTQKRDGVPPIIEFRVDPLPDSLENLNRFTLVSKSVPQYAALLLAVLALALSLYAFVTCIRTRIEKRKWLWLILCFVSVGRIGMSWTNGKSFFTPLWVQLPPATAFAQPYSAWVISLSIPLGAIVFLARRKRLSQGTPPPRIHESS